MAIIRDSWVLYTSKNRHGVAALNFANVSGCDQLVTGPTHVRGGTIDILMIDVPGLVRVAVVAPLGSSDHSLLSVAISMPQAIPNLCGSWRVLLKHRVNWTAVSDAIGELLCRSISSLTI